MMPLMGAILILFLSTLSLRRATSSKIKSSSITIYFYPRSPCGERRVTVLGIQHRVGISIHALLAESDLHIVGGAGNNTIHFYPRSPCGERQALGLLGWLRVLISIHALLAESDTPEEA